MTLPDLLRTLPADSYTPALRVLAVTPTDPAALLEWQRALDGGGVPYASVVWGAPSAADARALLDLPRPV